MATTKDQAYLKLARRALTPSEFAAFPEAVRKRRGRYATRRVRPRFWASLGKTLLILGLTALCTVFIVSGTLLDLGTMFGGGVSGHVTIDSCVHGAKSITCTGTFVSSDQAHPLEIDSVVVDAGGRVGTTVSGRVSGPKATHMYPAFSTIPLIPLTVFSAALLGLLTALLNWPVRSALHAWRPDLWPLWLGPSGPPRKLDRTPRIIRLASTVAYWWLGLTGIAFAVGFIGALAGPYGVGALVVIALAGGGWYLVRRLRPAAPKPGAYGSYGGRGV